jgi:hypothetical protein
VTDTRFGGSAGLLQRLRPSRIGVADLREVAGAVLPALATTDLRLDLVQRSGAGSLVVLQEDERQVSAHLGDLAEDMTRAGVSPTHEGMAAALVSWVAHCPVTDAAAATAGIAVLDWSDPSETAIGWRVVVRRGDRALAWTPSAAAEAGTVDRTRAAATRRARDVSLDLRVEGPVALWSHPVVPVLAGAALVDPERMLERIAHSGLSMPDMHVVVTPRRPVACAGPAIAARLSGEITEAGITLPWRRLSTLPWL